jgi:hypothetical protein
LNKIPVGVSNCSYIGYKPSSLVNPKTVKKPSIHRWKCATRPRWLCQLDQIRPAREMFLDSHRRTYVKNRGAGGWAGTTSIGLKQARSTNSNHVQDVSTFFVQVSPQGEVACD